MKKLKRMGALMLSVLLMCQTMIYVPAKAASSAEGSGTVALGSSAIAYSQKLTDNGNGTYTLLLTVKDASYVEDVNKDHTVSRNHYFTAPANGDYLFELWGGTGGDGSDSGDGQGGTGGDGGHVYGVITLSKGETLYYQLGGNGASTMQSDQGGGINGNGGASGGLSNYSIGGGGGYSAIYKFAAGEFESAYLDGEGDMTVENISEADRVSKFIAIAAGGGGGGAGSVGSSGIFDTGWLTDLGNPPHGGAGGSMESAAVAVDGGTVYVGDNGSSSGTSTAYVGLGGADTPATYADTISTLFTTVQANDWYAVTNTDLAGGAGGSGNLRGGGGGAGYAGGGGGIQESILRAAHVGGGGGGSSYLSDEVAALTAAQIENTGDKPEGGGAICITPVSDVAPEELEDLTLTIDPSDYFEVDVNGLEEGDVLSITNEPKTVEILFTPISGFAGGNNVPLLDGNAIACVNGEGTSCSIPLKANCAAVNVPLNFEAIGNTFFTTDAAASIQVSSLYTDNYVDARNALVNGSAGTEYAFISSITEYTVEDLSGNVVTGAVVPGKSTTYNVYFTVVPKAGTAAVVGEPVTQTTFRSTATVTIVSPNTQPLNKNAVTYSKALDYVNNQYVLTFEADINGDRTVDSVDGLTKDRGTSALNADVIGNYPVTQTGYYLIQIWGGDGGAGGVGSNSGLTASQGGAGGYVWGYVKLNEGDVINVRIGADGTKGQSSNYNLSGTGGTGGGYTAVYTTKDQTNTYMAVAAGGGGGGGNGYGSYLIWGSNYVAGVNGNSPGTTDKTFDSEGIDAYDGGPGGDGTVNIWGSGNGGGAGTAHNNYSTLTQSTVPPSGVTFDPSAQTILTNAAMATNPDDSTNGGGAVVITCLSVETEDEEGQVMKDYIFRTKISKYFEFTASDITATTIGADGNAQSMDLTDKITITENGNGEKELVIQDIDPYIKTTVSGLKNDYSAKFAVNIVLDPESGFMGGNDVPILIYDHAVDADLPSGMQLRQPDADGIEDYIDINVPGQEATDYANVAISYTVTNNEITAGAEEDRTIDQASAETYVYKSDLYRWDTNKPELYDQYGNKYWYADYVELVETVVKTATGAEEAGPTITPDPLVTTLYTVTVGLAPTVKTPGAIFIDPVSAEIVSRDIEVIVLPRIQYDLTDLTMSGTDAAQEDYAVTGEGSVTITSGESHEAILTAAEGYKLPDSITVKASDGTDISSLVGYNSTTGKFTVPARYAVGTITVSAAAVEETYSITVYYPDGLSYGSKVYGPYSEGYDISNLESSFPPMPPMTGHTFDWDWGAYEGVTTMPGQDLTVIGTYVANKYTLTVHHYKVGTIEPLAEDETFEVAYGGAQTVEAKVVTGWLASEASDTVTMDDINGKEYTFYYTATSGQLNITYLFADGSEAAEKYTQSISTDQTYSVTSPVLDGYTADQPVVSGTVSGTDAENGINITVTYTPNRYTVTFDPDGGSVSTASRQVEFGNIYGYDPEAGAWPGLPTPVRSGFDFAGWYLNGVEVTEGTTVDTAFDHTLTAQWTAREVTVTVRYNYEDGTLIPETTLKSYNPATQKGQTGNRYEFVSPALDGYNCDTAVVEGTFGTTSQVFVVTYTEKQYFTLTIRAKTSDGTKILDRTIPNVEAGTTHTEDLTTIKIDGYKPPSDSITIVMPYEDYLVEVIYSPVDVEDVISVTVTWGSLEFDYTYGAWQPTRHSYAEDTVEVAGNLSNYVTVTSNNESTVGVNVTVDYASLPEYTGITGYFTEGGDGTGTKFDTTYGQFALNPTESKTVYLWLDGTLDRGKAENTYQCGTCTVTITGGG